VERAYADAVPPRPERLARTFVDVADTLVADFDVVAFLTLLTSRTVELFELSEAGLLIADPLGRVRVAASSSHRMELLERFEIQHDEGPCLDSLRAGELVRCPDLKKALERWPAFAPEAAARGYGSVYALPLRLRTQVIGALSLLREECGELDASDLVAAQALADVATIAILQQRAASEQRILAEQLQYALDSRITIEQAKGVIAEHASLDMDEAFNALRQYARDHNKRLVDIARAVAARDLAAADVAADLTSRTTSDSS
jgi:transcriptional regulator with GAF, ATPase, and Fis domain